MDDDQSVYGKLYREFIKTSDVVEDFWFKGENSYICKKGDEELAVDKRQVIFIPLPAKALPDSLNKEINHIKVQINNYRREKEELQNEIRRNSDLIQVVEEYKKGEFSSKLGIYFLPNVCSVKRGKISVDEFKPAPNVSMQMTTIFAEDGVEAFCATDEFKTRKRKEFEEKITLGQKEIEKINEEIQKSGELLEKIAPNHEKLLK